MKIGILLSGSGTFDVNVSTVGVDYVYVNKPYYPAYSWPNYGWSAGKQIIWQQTYTEDPWLYYKAPAIQRKGLTNVAFVKWIFDIAAAQVTNHPENRYDFGCFLLSEEMYNPITTVGGQWAAWRCNLSEWVIDGTVDLGGQHIEALKPWYVRTIGAWNQTWWNNQVTTNQPDATTKAWAYEYYFKLHKAWVGHMHNIGKKAAIVGFTFAGPNWKTQAGYLYGSEECWKWVLDNYDFVMHYTYPMCMPPPIPCITGYQNRPFDTYVNIAEIQELRSLTRNTLAWNLTTRYADGYGSGDIELQRAEFNRVSPYVDVITASEVADMTVTPKVLMTQRLIDFANIVSPPPPPPPIEKWIVTTNITGPGRVQIINKNTGFTANINMNYTLEVDSGDIVEWTAMPDTGARFIDFKMPGYGGTVLTKYTASITTNAIMTATFEAIPVPEPQPQEIDALTKSFMIIGGSLILKEIIKDISK